MEKKDLEKMTITKLRDEALKYKDQIAGVIHDMDKDELVKALMDVLGIKEEVKPVEAKVKKRKKPAKSRESLKKEMKATQKNQNEALEAKDAIKARRLRKKVKSLKRKIRRIPKPAQKAA